MRPWHRVLAAGLALLTGFLLLSRKASVSDPDPSGPSATRATPRDAVRSDPKPVGPDEPRTFVEPDERQRAEVSDSAAGGQVDAAVRFVGVLEDETGRGLAEEPIACTTASGGTVMTTTSASGGFLLEVPSPISKVPQAFRLAPTNADLGCGEQHFRLAVAADSETRVRFVACSARIRISGYVLFSDEQAASGATVRSGPFACRADAWGAFMLQAPVWRGERVEVFYDGGPAAPCTERAVRLRCSPEQVSRGVIDEVLLVLPRPTDVITVSVQDRSGAPIRGARLGLAEQGPYTATDSQGMAELRVNSEDVVCAFAEGYAPEYVSASRATGGYLSIRLASQTSIEGIVQTRDGRVVPYADILVLRGGTEDAASFRTTADGEGRFHFRAEIDGEPYFLGAAKGALRGKALYWGDRGPVPPIIIPVALGSHLSGAVYDLDGTPISRARVRAVPVEDAEIFPAECRTDDAGAFELPIGVHERYELIVEKPGYVDHRSSVSATDTPTVYLDPAGWICGHVQRGDSAVRQFSVCVTLEEPDGGQRTVVSWTRFVSEDGRFGLRMENAPVGAECLVSVRSESLPSATWTGRCVITSDPRHACAANFPP